MHKINVIGNSHAWLFTGENTVRGVRQPDHKPWPSNNEFRVFPIGPATAFAFPTKHIKTVFEIATANKFSYEESILFVLGEVDCRWHIPKRVYGDGKDAWDEVTKVVDTYLFGLLEVAQIYKPIAWGVPPPGEGEHDPDYPRWGSRKERSVIVEMWNARMSDLCKAMGIEFKSIYWQIAQRYKENFYLDPIHLSQKAMPLARKELGL